MCIRDRYVGSTRRHAVAPASCKLLSSLGEGVGFSLPQRVVRCWRACILRQLVQRSYVRRVPALVDQLAQRLLDLPGVGSSGVVRRHVGLWGPWGLFPL